jgi:hypothetical protein
LPAGEGARRFAYQTLDLNRRCTIAHPVGNIAASVGVCALAFARPASSSAGWR